MSRAALVLIAVAVVALLVPRPSASVRGAPSSSPSDGGRSFTYEAGMDPGSRALVEQSVASARPEARRLIEAVDGLTSIRVGTPSNGALGTTQAAAGSYLLTLDLGATQRKTGNPGVVRMVLHELGHVVDHQLVPEALRAELDAGIPAGVPCPDGTRLGSCAPRAERFAETFAKWAMGNDLGATIYSGYAVPPPSRGFDAWAAPLTQLPLH